MTFHSTFSFSFVHMLIFQSVSWGTRDVDNCLLSQDAREKSMMVYKCVELAIGEVEESLRAISYEWSEIDTQLVSVYFTSKSKKIVKQWKSITLKIKKSLKHLIKKYNAFAQKGRRCQFAFSIPVHWKTIFYARERTSCVDTILVSFKKPVEWRSAA